MATSKARCVTCDKEKGILKCGGCSQDFCSNYFSDHRQERSKQLNEVEVIRDTLRQILTQQTAEPNKHVLIQQIDEWERESIGKIRQTAEEARELLLKYTAGHVTMEVKLNKLTNQLRESRQENDFFETDISLWKENLTILTDELNKSSNITIKQHSIPLVTKISVDIYSKIQVFV